MDREASRKPIRLAIGRLQGGARIVAALILIAGACSSADRLETVRLGGPADCASNPGCAPGLRTVYGVDLSDDLITTGDQQDTVAALERGDIDIGVVFTDGPFVEDASLRVLRDDRGMVGAENVVPVARRRAQRAVSALQPLQRALDQQALRDLNRAVLVDDIDENEAAARWLEERDLSGSNAAQGGAVKIGAQDLSTHEVLAHLYAVYLKGVGFDAQVVELGGLRNVEVDALANGDIDLVPEYGASLLEYLNGLKGEATRDRGATMARLEEYVVQLDAVLGEPARAESGNAFVMRAEDAERYGLATISDLRRTGAPQVEAAGAPPGPSGDPEIAVTINIPGERTLGVGDQGAEVEELQRRLNELGFTVRVTGVYGQQTASAVADFQRSQGLTPDGVVGAQTRRALADPSPRRPDAATPAPDEGNSGDSQSPPPERDGGGSVVYLTFDDGPHPTYTPQVLDILRRHNARATFFVLGGTLDRYRSLGRRVRDEGHVLANHTWTHRNLKGVSAAVLEQELVPTSNLIVQVGERKERCFRPPYGSTDATTVPRARALGFETLLWSIDTQDWRRPGAGAIANEVVKNVRAGSVVLMHDGGGDRTQTVEGLRQALDSLAGRGFTFAPMPQC